MSNSGPSSAKNAIFNQFIKRIKNIAQQKVPASFILEGLTLETLRAQETHGENLNMSVLWALASAAVNGNPQPFHYVWKEWGDKLTSDDFLVTVKAGSFEGVSVLWLLAFQATLYSPAPFKNVLLKWSNQITAQDLLVKPKGWRSKGVSALGLLMLHAARNDDPVRDFVHFLLTQIPGLSNRKTLSYKPLDNDDTIETLLQKSGDWSVALRQAIAERHIAARNAFLAQLARLSVGNQELDSVLLFKLAWEAFDAGLDNTFYVLGQFFESRALISQAYEAYDLVPSHSIDYFKANQIMGQIQFARALSENSSGSRDQALLSALHCALRAPETSADFNLSTRMQFIQLILICYIFEGKMSGLESKFAIPPDVVAMINTYPSPSLCWARFQEIKRTWLLEQENRALKLQLAQMSQQLEAFTLANKGTPQIFIETPSSRALVFHQFTAPAAAQASVELVTDIENRTVRFRQ